jgi:CBS domain-containing protein
MSLMVSRNGKIQEVTRKPSGKRVSSPENQNIAFEDIIDKESGHGPQYDALEEKESQSKRNAQDQKGDHERSPSHQGLKTYIKNKKAVNTKLIHAKEIGSRPVIYAHPKQTVSDAIELMKKYKIHHLPLLNKDQTLAGIISDRDLIGKRNFERLERLATTDVLVAKENTEIQMVARLMLDNGISALPLIDENNQLTGIITKSNLLEYIIKSSHFNRHV